DLPAGIFKNKTADVYYSSAIFGLRYELVWRQKSEFRMIPSYQSFKFINAAVIQIYYRLVKQSEFLTFGCVTQIGLNAKLIQISCMHFAVKDLISGFSGLFCSIHCRIGVAKIIFRLPN